MRTTKHQVFEESWRFSARTPCFITPILPNSLFFHVRLPIFILNGEFKSVCNGEFKISNLIVFNYLLTTSHWLFVCFLHYIIYYMSLGSPTWIEFQPLAFIISGRLYLDVYKRDYKHVYCIMVFYQSHEFLWWLRCSLVRLLSLCILRSSLHHIFVIVLVLLMTILSIKQVISLIES